MRFIVTSIVEVSKWQVTQKSEYGATTTSKRKTFNSQIGVKRSANP